MANIGYATMSVIPSLQGQMGQFGSQVESQMTPIGTGAGKKLGAAIGVGMAAVAGAAVVGKVLYDVGEAFDDMTETIRVGTGATGAALEDLRQSALSVGQNVPAEFGEIGTAVADLNTRLGLTGQPLEEMASQFLELSRITGTDVASNIATLTRTFGDWGIAAEDQAAAMDAIFRASQSTGIGIDALAGKVTQFGAPLRQLGFSFEESLAAFGKWEKEGVNAELVMGGLRQALGRFAAAGREPREAFDEVAAAIANAGSAGEANAIALETFGRRAGPDLAAAIREGRFSFEDLAATIASGDETILGAAEDTRDLAESWQIFKNRVLVGIEPIATRVFNALGDGMQWVIDNMGGFSAAWDQAREALAPVGDFIRDIFSSLEGEAASGAFDPIIQGARDLGGALQTAWSVAAPILQQIGDVIRSTFGDSEGGAGDIVRKAAETIGLAMSAIATIMQTNWTIIQGIWQAFGPTILGLLGNAFETVKGLVQGAMDVIQGIIRTVTALIQGDWSGAWAGIRQIAEGALRIIQSLISGAVGQIRVVMANAWAAVRGNVESAWAGITSSVAARVSALIDLIRGLPGRFVSALGNLGSLLRGAGRALIQGLIDGIRSRIAAVGDAAGAVAAKIRGFFPGSPVAEGPLRSWNNGGAGKRLGTLLADGLQASINDVQSASRRLAGAVVTPVAPGSQAGVLAGATAGGGAGVFTLGDKAFLTNLADRQAVVELDGMRVGQSIQRANTRRRPGR